MNYQEYKEQQQREFNELPLFFAFSDEQFAEAMEKRGLTMQDVDKVYRWGALGAFYLKKDADIIRDFCIKPDPLKELMKDAEFAESAFYYEMANHEYHINWQGDWDVCSCFGTCDYAEDKSYVEYLTELGYDAGVVRAYNKAMRRFFADCEENDWY